MCIFMRQTHVSLDLQYNNSNQKITYVGVILKYITKTNLSFRQGEILNYIFEIIIINNVSDNNTNRLISNSVYGYNGSYQSNKINFEASPGPIHTTTIRATYV